MRFEIFDDPDSAARTAAATIAADSRAATTARGHFALAVRGGHTPWIMLGELANEDIAWAGMHVFQVDERVAPPRE
jgi:6-phosphogluconolactonase